MTQDQSDRIREAIRRACERDPHLASIIWHNCADSYPAVEQNTGRLSSFPSSSAGAVSAVPVAGGEG